MNHQNLILDIWQEISNHLNYYNKIKLQLTCKYLHNNIKINLKPYIDTIKNISNENNNSLTSVLSLGITGNKQLINIIINKLKTEYSNEFIEITSSNLTFDTINKLSNKKIILVQRNYNLHLYNIINLIILTISYKVLNNDVNIKLIFCWLIKDKHDEEFFKEIIDNKYLRIINLD